MRRDDVAWARPCHKTKEDTTFWKMASLFFAQGSHLQTHRQWLPYYLLVNYGGEKLRSSFLYKYEAPAIALTCQERQNCRIVIVDWHNLCDGAVKELAGRLRVSFVECVSPTVGHKSMNQVTALADNFMKEMVTNASRAAEAVRDILER